MKKLAWLLLGAALLLPMAWVLSAALIVGLPLWLAHGWIFGPTQREREAGRRRAEQLEQGMRELLAERRLLDTPQNRQLVALAPPRRRPRRA